jgi:hypothetical protein
MEDPFDSEIHAWAEAKVIEVLVRALLSLSAQLLAEADAIRGRA